MTGERVGIARQAAMARRQIGHLPRRGHVTALALLALGPCRALEPFGIRTVDLHAEDGPLMARGAIAALPVNRGKDILATVDVVQRAEEELAARRPQQLQAEPA